VLEGITRAAVREICASEAIPFEARAVHPDELEGAQEVFASSTAGGIMPVTRIDGRPIGNGHPGLVTSRIQSAYWARREAGWHGTPVRELLGAPA